jgi:hypothetical protein
MHPLTAADTVSLAMERTKRMLFRPFRLSLFWRLALLALFSGEMNSGIGLPNFNFTFPRRRMPLPEEVKAHVGLLIFAIAGAVVLYFVFLYIASVLQFVLYEAVLTGTTRIRDGWRRWRERAGSFYAFNIGMLFLSLLIAAIFGVPAFLAYRSGVFSASHSALITFVIVVYVVLALCVFVAEALVWVMTKDFVVPIMMLEGVSAVDGWRRAWPLIRAEGKRYTGFYALKIVLRIAAGVLMGIAVVVFVLLLLIPVVIGAVVMVGALKGSGGAGALAGTLLVLAALYIAAVAICGVLLAGTPVAVFFTSYTLQFFGWRYMPLRALLYPEPPPIPPSAVPVVPTPVPPPTPA